MCVCIWLKHPRPQIDGIAPPPPKNQPLFSPSPAENQRFKVPKCQQIMTK